MNTLSAGFMVDNTLYWYEMVGAVVRVQPEIDYLGQ